MSAQRHLQELPPTPDAHFRLHVYAAILLLRRALPPPDAVHGVGFLDGYYDELARAGFAEPGGGEDARWWALVRAWEADAPGHLPLRALRRDLGLSPLALALLMAAGIAEEDARFGRLFEALTGVAGEQRPTFGLLAGWTGDDRARDALIELLALGLVDAVATGAPRPTWPLTVRPLLWDALRGCSPGDSDPAVAHVPLEGLPELSRLVLPPSLATALGRAPLLLGGPRPGAVVVRGPRSSGRHTVLAALARALGRGTLVLRDPAAAAVAAPLATALDALPILALEPAAGETLDIPVLRGHRGPLGVVAGLCGGLRGERAVTFEIGIPDPALRARLWAQGLGDGPLSRELAVAMRVTAGTIRRAARGAWTEAQLAGRGRPSAGDVRSAMRRLESEDLETLAARVPVVGGWDDLAAEPETRAELRLLEQRCRERERLRDGVGVTLRAGLTAGVRALLSGPSGTGKTLAARLLAAQLGKELFAIDLAAVVNKYLGETEKSLDAVFSRAEALDVILLLDEGDALMTRRTDVQTSNDRYANLETNFLLQRLESYEGIFLVTTNAGERIDQAFRRRLDVVIEFRTPEAAERWSIWTLHLPEHHVVPAPFLDEVAVRCKLTGGQIRNAVLHASLLAAVEGEVIGAAELDAAVRREYRKAGAVCPLRTGVAVGG